MVDVKSEDINKLTLDPDSFNTCFKSPLKFLSYFFVFVLMMYC